MVKKDETKALIDSVNELSQSYADLADLMKSTSKAANNTRKLWRKGKRSWLIKVGLALIAFPDPTVSDVLGTAMVAAGVVQEGIRRRTLHIEDLGKEFEKTLREIKATRESF